MQRYIRGSGLAYGASIGADLETGQVSFSIYRVLHLTVNLRIILNF
jgi:Zn-dependent M16 (insulinase) family peptidase